MTDQRHRVPPAVTDAELAADRWTVLREPSRRSVRVRRAGATALIGLWMVTLALPARATGGISGSAWIGLVVATGASLWIWRAAARPGPDPYESMRLTGDHTVRDRRRIVRALLRGERPRGRARAVVAVAVAEAETSAGSTAMMLVGFALVLASTGGRSDPDGVLDALLWGAAALSAVVGVHATVRARRLRDAAASVGVVARVAPRAQS